MTDFITNLPDDVSAKCDASADLTSLVQQTHNGLTAQHPALSAPLTTELDQGMDAPTAILHLQHAINAAVAADMPSEAIEMVLTPIWA